jgi:hypothetical protein
MIRPLLSMFCLHLQTTFPIELGGQTYARCLWCGRRFAYDWERMRRESEIPVILNKNDARKN